MIKVESSDVESIDRSDQSRSDIDQELESIEGSALGEHADELCRTLLHVVSWCCDESE